MQYNDCATLMNKIKHIKKAIIKTLSFYDLFDFPMTNTEIYHNLWGISCTLADCQAAIDDMLEKGELGYGHGFYHLPGREELVKIRQERYVNSFKKWHLVKKYRWVWPMIPFLKMVGIVNTLAYSNAKKDGDIDLLVVTKKNRIFTTRLFITAWLLILNMWRYHQLAVANKFCLSFFLSENNLNLKKLLMDDNDVYLVYWTKWTRPIYCSDMHVANRYWRENKWIKDYIPNAGFYNLVANEDSQNWWGSFWEWVFGGWLGNRLENILKKLMLSKIKKNDPKDDKDGIMANSRILKFHPTGKRMEYAKRWLEKIGI